jgi:nitroreductase
LRRIVPNSSPFSSSVLAAISERRSVRAFREQPVPEEIVRTILGVAARAPSGNNTQPWRVHVLVGAAKERLSAAILQERSSGEPEPAMEYAYYPAQFPEPHLGLRRELGWSLYRQLGIRKGDRAASRRWQDQNFNFFGASVGMIFTMDRRLGLGSLIDIGMFLKHSTSPPDHLGSKRAPKRHSERITQQFGAYLSWPQSRK